MIKNSFVEISTSEMFVGTRLFASIICREKKKTTERAVVVVDVYVIGGRNKRELVVAVRVTTNFARNNIVHRH